MDQEKFNLLYDDGPNLRDLFRTINRWKKTIIAVALIAMLLSGIISIFFLDPVYEATTYLAVSQSQQKTQAIDNQIEDMVDELSKIPYMSVETCIEQINSSSILQIVIDKLELPYKRSELGNMIKAETMKNTNLIKLTVSNNDPELAAKIANELRTTVVENINKVNAQKLEQSLDIMQSDWMQKEQADLADANAKLKDYKIQSRSIEFLSTQLTQRTENLGKLQSDLLEAETQRDKLKNGIAQDKENIENTPVTLTTKNIAEGILPSDFNGIDIKNGTVESENINEAYTELIKSYNLNLSNLMQTEAAINRLNSQIKQLTQEIPVLEAELTENQIEEKTLQNEVDRREEVVNLLSSKIAETKMTQSTFLAENSINTISPAIVPEEPVKPRKIINIVIAGILGLVSSVSAVLFIEYMREEKNKELNL